MNPKRPAVLLTSILLLSACTTSSGIVDNFNPPQAQPAEVKTTNCTETIADRNTPGQPPSGTGSVGNVAPCIVETAAVLASAVHGQTPATRRPRLMPPMFGRR